MAGFDNICLRLNEFEESTMVYWQELRMEDNFCDMSLACEDKIIKAHKVIISFYSPIIKSILMSNETSHSLIYLKGVRYKDLQYLIEFMYQGKVVIPEEDVSCFLEVAEDLNVRGLSKIKKEGYGLNEVSQLNINVSLKGKNTVNYKRDSLSPLKKELCSDSSDENISEINQLLNTNTSVTEKNIVDTKLEPIGTLTELEKYVVKVIPNDNVNDIFSSISTCKVNVNEDQENVISAPKRKKLLCGKCDEYFYNKQSLYNHKKTMHEGVPGTRKFLCGKCDKTFFSGMGLNHHKKSIHDGVRYPCVQCNYKAYQPKNLERHIKSIHEGVKYPCNQCGLKASDESGLRKHINSIHKGECYPCGKCEYTSSQKASLRKHEMKHHS